VNDPGGALIVIDEVPDSPAAGYLVLPAFERLAFPYASSEGSFEPVLPFRDGTGSGIRPDRLERAAQVSGSLRREIVPSASSIVRSEPQVVLP